MAKVVSSFQIKKYFSSTTKNPKIAHCAPVRAEEAGSHRDGTQGTLDRRPGNRSQAAKSKLQISFRRQFCQIFGLVLGWFWGDSSSFKICLLLSAEVEQMVLRVFVTSSLVLIRTYHLQGVIFPGAVRRSELITCGSSRSTKKLTRWSPLWGLSPTKNDYVFLLEVWKALLGNPWCSRKTAKYGGGDTYLFRKIPIATLVFLWLSGCGPMVFRLGRVLRKQKRAS